MATATTAKPAPSREDDVAEAARLLETLLTEKPYISGGAIASALTGEHIDRIRDLLPESLKADAERFVKRGLLYFSRKPDLEECTVASKIKCILDAAELGLALDGRLCHAVSYNCKYKDSRGAERWRKEVQCQPDYKGLVVVAKRCGQIVDCYGDVICQNDHFKHGRKDATHFLEHTYPIGERGEVVGAYAIVKLPGGDWRYELMSLSDLNKIQARSKAQNSGPWKTDPDQMRIKTVMRRILKMYSDDPGVAKAIELDEREYGTDDGAWIPETGKVRISDLNRSLASEAEPANGAQTQPEDAWSDAGREMGFGPAPEEESQVPPEPSDAPLSALALEFEEKLHGPLTRQQNMTLMQDIAAAKGKLTEAESAHLRKIAEENAIRLKGAK